MGLVVNTNIASMNALRHLSSNQMNLTKTIERISSGMRINNASDDAAGLGVAEKLDGEKMGLEQASRNGNDGISVAQTIDGASNEVSNILKRMRQLAVQSASDVLATTERGFIQTEFTQLSAQVDNIAQVTQFSGVSLANGSKPAINVQVGIGNTPNDRIAIALGDLRATTLKVDAGSMSLSKATSAQAALTVLDAALDQVNTQRANYGATQNRLESTLRNLDQYTSNIAAAESRIRDADLAVETSNMAKYQILQQAGVSVLGQANNINQSVVKLLG